MSEKAVKSAKKGTRVLLIYWCKLTVTVRTKNDTFLGRDRLKNKLFPRRKGSIHPDANITGCMESSWKSPSLVNTSLTILNLPKPSENIRTACSVQRENLTLHDWMTVLWVTFVRSDEHPAGSYGVGWTCQTVPVDDYFASKAEPSAKVISFWCCLVAFDHACHVSKQ